MFFCLFFNVSQLFGGLFFNAGIHTSRHANCEECLVDCLVIEVTVSRSLSLSRLLPPVPVSVSVSQLPDVSGTVITTGNLVGLPSVSIPTGHLFVGGNSTFEGNARYGRNDTITTVGLFSWVNGSVGLHFASPSQEDGAFEGGMYARATSSADSLHVTLPHLGGVDTAIRHYLARGAESLAVDVQGDQSFRAPIANTSSINEAICLELLEDKGVRDFYMLSVYMVREAYVKPTRLTGAPYAAVYTVRSQTPRTP